MLYSKRRCYESLEHRNLLAGNTVDGPNADLIYHPATGTLTVDLTDLDSPLITAISLVNNNEQFEAEPWADSEIDLFLPVRNGKSGFEGLVDRSDQRFEQATLGRVLRANLFANTDEMAEFFDDATYTSGNQFDFDLIVAGIEADVRVAETGVVDQQFLLGQPILVSGTVIGSNAATVTVDVQSDSPLLVETDADGNFEAVVTFPEPGPKLITVSSDLASLEIPISIAGAADLGVSLSPSSLSLRNNELVVGEEVELAWIVTNNSGSDVTGGWTSSVVIRSSLGEVLENISTRTESVLQSGESVSQSTAFVIPDLPNPISGDDNFAIEITVGIDDQLAEPNADDNAVTLPIKLVRPVDVSLALSAAMAELSGTELSGGQQLTLEWSVLNESTEELVGAQSDIFLLDGDGVRVAELATGIPVGDLASGNSILESAVVSLPNEINGELIQGNFSISIELDLSDIAAPDLDNSDNLATVPVAFSKQQSSNPTIEFTDRLGDDNSGNVVAMFAADLDTDSDADILFSNARSIGWLQNDGSGGFSQLVINAAVNGPESVFAADIDGDGDVDVLSASKGSDEIFWHENLDAKGEFSEKKLISNEIDEGRAAVAIDVDSDGDLDVVSGSLRDSKVAWYENRNGLGTFGEQQVISADTFALSVTTADLDGDGDQDLIVTTIFDVVWFENTNGQFSDAQTISLFSADRVVVADIDGDGDKDVAVPHNDNVSWYRNVDGKGYFDTAELVSDQIKGGSGIDAADIDDDGDVDIVSASRVDNKIAWYQNLDGVGGFGEQQLVDQNAAGAWFVLLADFDNDRDADIAASVFEETAIEWYESDLVSGLSEPLAGDANSDGSVNFLDFLVLANNFGDSVVGGVLDGDFDEDGVVSFLDFLALANNFGSSAR